MLTCGPLPALAFIQPHESSFTHTHRILGCFGDVFGHSNEGSKETNTLSDCKAVVSTPSVGGGVWWWWW